MKKIIALLLVVSIAFCSFTALAINSNQDNKNRYYSEAAAVVAALKISAPLTDENSEISRIDLLKAVVGIITKNTNFKNAQLQVPFVDISDEDRGTVAYAMSVGLIPNNGVYFKPDDAADYNFTQQTVSNAVTFYKYPKATASKAQLESGLNLKSGGNFKRSDAYVMLYNMLCSDDMLILKSVYDINAVIGYMVANSGEAYSGAVCKENYIRIKENGLGNERELKYAGETDELLGRAVKVYYNSEDEVAVVIAIYDDIVAEIDGKEFFEYNPSKRELKWDKQIDSSVWNSKSKVQTKNIPQDIDIVFNNRFTTKHSEVYDILENGKGYNIDKITLYDVDTDGKTDLMKISAYKAVAVDFVDTQRLIVNGKGSGEIIDFDKDNAYMSVQLSNVNSNKLKFSDIKADTTLSVFSKLDQRTGEADSVKAVLSSEKVSGRLTAINNKSGVSEIEVGGNKYTLAQSLRKDIANLQSGTLLSVGKSYTFFIDHKGFVVYGEMIAGEDNNIGVVIKAGIKDKMDRDIIVKIYTADGEMLELTAANKFKIDGKAVNFKTDGTAVYENESGDETDAISAIYGSVVRYELSSEGDLRCVELPKMNPEDGEFGYSAGINDIADVETDLAKYKLIYKSADKYFIPGFASNRAKNFIGINAKTKVIKVPSKSVTTEREQCCSIGSISDFKGDGSYAAFGYTINGGHSVIADVIVVLSDDTADFKGAAFSIVKDIFQTTNKAGGIGYEFVLVNSNNGKENKITTESLNLPEYDYSTKLPTGNELTVEKGDIIRYSLNSYGDANAFILDYDCSQPNGAGAREENVNWPYGSQRLVYGSVYDGKENLFTYVPGSSITGNDTVMVGMATRIICVDFGADEEKFITVSTAAAMNGYKKDPVNYSHIIYISQNGNYKGVVEYRR